MSRRYYNSPFESEKFQFTEGHFVLRGAKSQRVGQIFRGDSYDRSCNKFCQMMVDGKLERIRDDEYTCIKTDEEDGYTCNKLPENFKFNVSDDIVMVPVYSFGTSNLFVPVDGSEFFKYHMENAKWYNETNRNHYENYSFYDTANTEEPIIISHVGKVIGDAPIKLGVNSKHDRIFGTPAYSSHTFDSLIHIYMMKNLTKILNEYYTENSIDCRAFFDIMKLDIDIDEYYGECEDEDNVERVESIQEAISKGINFIPDEMVNLIVDPDAKVIIRLLNGEYRMISTYNIPIEDLNENWAAWVRIPDSNIWQAINKVDYKTLRRIEKLTVTYSQVDKPRFFDKVYYTTDHTANSMEDILRLCAILTTDLDYTFFVNRFSRIRKANRGYGVRTQMFIPTDGSSSVEDELKNSGIVIEPNLYEAISISIEQFGVIADVTLTQEELGICNGMSQAVKSTRYIQREDESIPQNNAGSRFRNNFCLLNLITNIANLQYSMNESRKRDAYYFD